MVTAVVTAANRPFAAICCCSRRRPAVPFSSPPILFDSRNPKSHLYQSITQLGALRLLSPWSGLKHLGIQSRPNYGLREKKGKYRGKVVYASLFGVGAPEALVIGVVALLVFGPKGLAEVARNLGKTLRAFQPTIRELQEVSREFKSTLEREIGLDEVASSTNNAYKPASLVNENQQAIVDPNGTPKTEVYTTEDLVKITQEQFAASATGSQTQASSPQEQPQDGTPKNEVYKSEDLVKITQEQFAASATGPQTQAFSPQEQPQDVVADTPSEVTASVAPDAAAKIPSSEKADKER